MQDAHPPRRTPPPMDPTSTFSYGALPQQRVVLLVPHLGPLRGGAHRTRLSVRRQFGVLIHILRRQVVLGTILGE